MKTHQEDLQMTDAELPVQNLLMMDFEMMGPPGDTIVISPTHLDNDNHKGLSPSSNAPSAGIQASSAPTATFESNSGYSSASLDESSSAEGSSDDEDSSSDDDSSSDEESDQPAQSLVAFEPHHFWHDMEPPEPLNKLYPQGYIGRRPGLMWSETQYRYMTRKAYIAAIPKKQWKAYKLGKLWPFPMTMAEHDVQRRNKADVKKTRRYLAEERSKHRGIKRNPYLQASLEGKLLGREIGRKIGHSDNATTATGFAHALEYMGHTDFTPQLSQPGHISCLFVTNNHAGAEAVAYAGSTYGPLSSGLLEREDATSKLRSRNLLSHIDRNTHSTAYNGVVTSVSYNSHHNKMIATRAGHNMGFCAFSPVLEYPNGDDSKPSWKLSEIERGTYHHYDVEAHSAFGHRFLTDSACGGANAEYVASISTNCGLLLLQSDDRLVACRPDDMDARSLWCTDFKHGENNVVYAGADNNLVWLVDTRTRWANGMWINFFGPVRRVISVSSHEVLAAGEESMALYDIRALRSKTVKPKLVDTPVATFPDHENNSKTPGVAVNLERGLVAASQTSLPEDGDGYLALFSLRSGARLTTPGLTSYRHNCSNAMAFEKLWDEDHPSLLVGAGSSIYKYSVRHNGETDWMDDDDDDDDDWV